jgi:hypothetical protein
VIGNGAPTHSPREDDAHESVHLCRAYLRENRVSRDGRVEGSDCIEGGGPVRGERGGAAPLGTSPHTELTRPGIDYGQPRPAPGRSYMDAMYLAIIAALYAATHWLVKAVSRLGEEKK